MRREDRTELLVVGAGPVGMFTALRLATSGIGVQVIDQESRTAGHSYACALHPRTLQLLDREDLAREAIQRGHRIESVAFYEGAARRAEVKLSRISAEYPFALVLAQSALEDLLENKLKERGVKVQWNHRLADLRLEEDAVVVAIEELALAGKGYVVPDFEMEVKRTMSARADFVVGTDGQHSAVRQRLGIPCEDAGQPEQFLVCELETEKPVPAEMSIVLHEQTVNVLWPLAENRCRWTFQLSKAGPPADFPQKDRNRFTVAELAGKQGNRPQLEQLLAARAPWFRAGIKNAAWSAQLQFAQRVARPFGRGRAWLAGDAAHQTSPIGMQSMNMGMREGAGLAAKLKQILRDAGSPELLASYNLEQGKEWERLLGLSGAPKPGAGCGEWVRKQSARLLSCLPATGVELGLFLRQLGLEFDAGGAAAAATPG